MADWTTLTGWLIIAVGLYSAAAGAGMALDPDRFRRMFAEIEDAPAVNYIAGLIVFAIGVAVLLVHPPAARWPDILVAILGWGALVEGMLFLAAPKVIWAIARPFLKGNIRLWGLAAFVAGLVLLFVGWADVVRTTVTLV